MVISTIKPSSKYQGRSQKALVLCRIMARRGGPVWSVWVGRRWIRRAGSRVDLLALLFESSDAVKVERVEAV